jgi:Sulfotransferase family
MDEYSDFVYLDVQKTGSGFTSKFLAHCCTSKQLRFKKHGRIREDYNPDKFYFITVREPLSQYISLYRYSLGRKGAMFRRLEKDGHGDLYAPDNETFNRWMAFVLDEKNAELLGEGFQHAARTGIGLQTYRFIVLALQSPP